MTSPTRSAAAILARVGVDVEHCREYIVGRQTPEGGFCFYRYGAWGVEEPNAGDTGSAVASLTWLDEPVPRREQLIGWLLDQQATGGGYSSPMIADAVLSALQCLEARPRYDPSRYLLAWARRISATDLASMDARAWLDSARRCARLLVLHGVSVLDLRNKAPSVLAKQRHGSGGYIAEAPNLLSTWHALELMATLQLRFDSKETIDFLRECEHAQWGFTLAPASTATSLEVQWAGTRALRRVGAPPRWPDAVQRFAARCQSPGGGFSRVPGALPGLQETAWALGALTRLATNERSG